MLNVSCPKAQLHTRIQTVSHGVSGRSTQPVQNQIYMEAAGGKLRLVATDLEFISLEAVIDAQVAEEGKVTVPARLMSEVTGAAAGEEITLQADERDTVLVTSAGARWAIRGMSAADFEMLPELIDPTELQLPQGALHDILSQTVFATSQDETRPILTGALFKIQPGGLEVVATDTYRLALRKLTAEIPIAEPHTAIISARALNEVLRVLDPGSDEPVNMALSSSQVSFVVNNVTVGSRLIEGQFPNYEKVLPDSSDRRVTVDRRQFSDALRRAHQPALHAALHLNVCGHPGHAARFRVDALALVERDLDRLHYCAGDRVFHGRTSLINRAEARAIR